MGREDWTLGKTGSTAGVGSCGAGVQVAGPRSHRSLLAAHLWSDPLVWQLCLGVMGWHGAPPWVECPCQSLGVGVEETDWTHTLSLRGHLVTNRRGSMGPGLCCPLPPPVGICQGTDLQKLSWVWLSGHGLLVQG